MKDWGGSPMPFRHLAIRSRDIWLRRLAWHTDQPMPFSLTSMRDAA